MILTRLGQLRESDHITAKFFRFAAVGGVGTLAHYATLVALVQIASVNAVIASGSGFVVGAIINYYLNYIFTFRSNKRHREAFVKFFLVVAVGLGLNSLVMVMTVQILEWHYLVSQVVATGLVLVWNFMGNHFWTFAQSGMVAGNTSE